jgi:serine/threonine-protein kinase RsbW
MIPSETGVGRQVMEEVLDQLLSHNWMEHDVFSIRLAMEEALVNAITHGNRRDSSKQIHICCSVASEAIRIEITDEGEGFNPVAVPNPTDPDRRAYPGGRGVMLMKHFMSRVEFNDTGNTVVMEKERAKE